MCSQSALPAAPTAYKRGTLVFHDVERLQRLAKQAVRSSSCSRARHTPGSGGQGDDPPHSRHATATLGRLCGQLRYDLGPAVVRGGRRLAEHTAAPMEASGTSGMKAAMNGVPSLSVLDGWWVEGHIEGVTGWSIGEKVEACTSPSEEAEACHRGTLRQTRTAGAALLLQGTGQIHRDHETHDCDQRGIFQYAAHGRTVSA